MSKLAFGKAVEYRVASEMILNGFEVYLPIVDDHGVDIVARTPLGNIVEIQVKALSRTTKGGLFAAINHTPKTNFYFVFYLESIDKMWIISSTDFVQLASQNKQGGNVGKYSINILKKACAPFRVSNYNSIR